MNRREEDERLIKRLIDAPARRVYHIPVGGMTSKDVDRFLRETRKRFKDRFQNPMDGRLDKFNPNA